MKRSSWPEGPVLTEVERTLSARGCQEDQPPVELAVVFAVLVAAVDVLVAAWLLLVDDVQPATTINVTITSAITATFLIIVSPYSCNCPCIFSFGLLGTTSLIHRISADETHALL